MSGIIVQPTYNEIIDMYTAMGEPELTDDVLSKIRDEIFPLDKFRELIVNHKDRVHLYELCDEKNLKCTHNVCSGFGGNAGWRFSPKDVPHIQENYVFVAKTLKDAIAFVQSYQGE